MKLTGKLELGSIHYYSAITFHLSESTPHEVAAHKTYVECLQADGVVVNLSRFHLQETMCPSCSSAQVWPVEKETDVSITIKMVDLAVHQSCNVLALISADSDQRPTLEWLNSFDTDLRTVAILPFARGSKELTSVAHHSIKLRAESYAKCQFSTPYQTSTGRLLQKPAHW